MLDVKIPARGRFSHALPPLHSAFAYVIDGAVSLGPSETLVRQGQLAVLGPGEVALARTKDGGRMLLVAAAPIGEPVARSGPFVMNTEAELRQAWEDYRSGRLVTD
jgi:redox-sensitive bicupin YhaK (pirin superfamily)